MIMRIAAIALVCSVSAASAASAGNKATEAAKNAVDPDCTVEKAAKGAAMKATVGVGNRCSVDETARDVTGVDGKGKPVKKKLSD